LLELQQLLQQQPAQDLEIEFPVLLRLGCLV